MPTLSSIQPGIFQNTRTLQLRQGLAESSKSSLPSVSMDNTVVRADKLATALRASTMVFGSTGSELNPDTLIASIPTATAWQQSAILPERSQPKRTSAQPRPDQTSVVSFAVFPYAYALLSPQNGNKPILTATKINAQQVPVGKTETISLTPVQQEQLNNAIDQYGRPALVNQIAVNAERRLPNVNGSWRYTEEPSRPGHSSLSFRLDNQQFTLVKQDAPINKDQASLPFTPRRHELRHTNHTNQETHAVPLTAAEYQDLNTEWRSFAMPVLKSAHRLDDNLDVNGHLAELTRLIWNDSPFISIEQPDDRPHELRITTLPVNDKPPLVTSPLITPHITRNPTTHNTVRMFSLNNEDPNALTLTMYNPPFVKLQKRLDQPDTAELARLLSDVTRFKLATRDHGLRHLVVQCLCETAEPPVTTPSGFDNVHKEVFPQTTPHHDPIEHRTQADLLSERVERLIPKV